MVFIRMLVLTAAISVPVRAGALDIIALEPDTPTKIQSIEAVCTGVSLDARENPVWATYPLKIEIAGRGGQYLGDVELTVAEKDRVLAKLSCGGPWLLLRLPFGHYRIAAQTEGTTVTSSAFVPKTGQGHVILRFPNLGGERGPAPAGTGDQVPTPQP
jgi:hypothetical protein